MKNVKSSDLEWPILHYHLKKLCMLSGVVSWNAILQINEILVILMVQDAEASQSPVSQTRPGYLSSVVFQIVGCHHNSDSAVEPVATWQRRNFWHDTTMKDGVFSHGRKTATRVLPCLAAPSATLMRQPSNRPWKWHFVLF